MRDWAEANEVRKRTTKRANVAQGLKPRIILKAFRHGSSRALIRRMEPEDMMVRRGYTMVRSDYS